MSAPGPPCASLPPLSLYVHLPWCVRKCPYCDFNSYTLHGELPESAYIDALLADLDAQLPELERREIASVFFGGGTPSLFAPTSIARLLGALGQALPVAADVEVTLEANPGTIEHGRFGDYRAAGVNRVSLGAQSFTDESLQQLGRIHAAGDTRRAVQELRDAGIDNFNLDLMYALPHQTLAAALSDLESAIALGPAHISHYELTLEPGTVFGGVPPAGLPDADLAMEMQLACQQRLADAGYVQYEVSAYAREGRRCRHNLNYWRFGDYLGVGAGAHSKLSFADRIVRQVRRKQPKQYLEGAAAGNAMQEQHDVAYGDIGFEFMMNALRLGSGFPVALFEERSGLPLTAVLKPLEEAERRGLITRDHQRVAPTELGRRFLNDLLQIFLPEEQRI